MNSIIWDKPPESSRINEGIVDIYAVSINSVKHKASFFKGLLNSQELKRASGYHFEKDRLTCIVSRGILKLILGSYISRIAEDVIICIDKYGKPYIESDNLSFNLSHSGDAVLYSVTSGRNVGVDIQHMREIDSMDDIVERFFSEDEISDYRSLPEHLKKEGFYNCWSRKEAYIKALGLGLSYPLDSFTVSLIPGSDVKLLNDKSNDISQWSLKGLPVFPEYAAAVAVFGTDINYNCYRWSI